MYINHSDCFLQLEFLTDKNQDFLVLMVGFKSEAENVQNNYWGRFFMWQKAS